MLILRRLWNDEAGFVISAELVLVTSILIIGAIVGLTALRNQVVQELIDVGQAIGSLSQSFSFSSVQGSSGAQTNALTDGSPCKDLVDFYHGGQCAGQSAGGVSMGSITGGEQTGESNGPNGH